MAPILLLALLGFVQPYKLSLNHPGGQIDNQTPPPQPPQPQFAPLIQQQEQLEQQTLLHPNNDYAKQEESYNGGFDTKGAPAKPERDFAYRPTQQGYLPNPHPQALAYVIVRPIQYPQNGYSGPIYNNYGYDSYNHYGRLQYNNQYRPQYYESQPYGAQPPFSGYNLRDQGQHPEGEYQQSKDGDKQPPQQSDQQPPPPADQQPIDLYAEKKGKLQRIMDKIHSIIPFGSTYQINDDSPAPESPQPQPQMPQPAYRQPAFTQQQPLSQVSMPIPEQQSLNQQQLQDDREVIREPEPLHQEQLKEEKGHNSKSYREPAGESKRDKDQLNYQQLNLPQDADSGFASSKRVSNN